MASSSNTQVSNTTAQATSAVPDDEFEDFPHEDWTNEETSLGVKKEWEDSWDDDDIQDDFSKQLKAELAKQDGDVAMKHMTFIEVSLKKDTKTASGKVILPKQYSW